MKYFIIEKGKEDDFYRDHRVVGIDFDGTLVEATHPVRSPKESTLLPGAKEGMEELKRQGWIIVIDSCRNDKKGIEEFLKSKDIPFDYVGRNPYAPKGTCATKLYANVKLDDKVETFRGWKTAVKQINVAYERYEARFKNDTNK